MKVNVTTRHIENKRQANYMREYALKKVSRLERYMESKDPSDVKIILSSEKLRNNAEIIVSSGNLKATAAVELEDMHAAIDKVFDAIVKQLRRRTDKKSTTRRRAGSKNTNPTQNSKNKNENKIIEEKLPAKPMSLDEAILQLKVSDENYVVFRNSETLEMNVIYNDKNSKAVNLITP